MSGQRAIIIIYSIQREQIFKKWKIHVNMLFMNLDVAK